MHAAEGPGTGATVLVVDDDEAIRSSLERALRLEGFDARTAADGYRALNAIEQGGVDLVVLDVTMPGIDGVEVTRRLRARGDDVPVLILSARSEVDDRVAGLQAGADDYLVKPFAVPELVARLVALRRRRPAAEPDGVLRYRDLTVEPQGRRAARAGSSLDLTRREFDLLESLVRNAEIVRSRNDLLLDVWGYDFEVESNVVDVFVGYLRRKLEADGRPRLIQTVRGVGFVLREAP